MANWNALFGKEFSKKLVTKAGDDLIRQAGRKLKVAERFIEQYRKSGKPLESDVCFHFLQTLITDPLLAYEIKTAGALGWLNEKFLADLPSISADSQAFDVGQYWESHMNLPICAAVLADVQSVYQKLLNEKAKGYDVQSFALLAVIKALQEP